MSTPIIPRPLAGTPAAPCNDLVDGFLGGTLERVVHVLSMLSCVDFRELTEHPAMGIQHSLHACIDALEFEMDRAKSNTTEEPLS